MSSHIKKIVALVLSFTMIFTSGALTVFAEKDTPQNTIKYVALGDSMSQGYMFTDYSEDGSHSCGWNGSSKRSSIVLFKNYLAEKHNATVDLTDLSIQGFQPDELWALFRQHDEQGYSIANDSSLPKGSQDHFGHWTENDSWGTAIFNSYSDMSNYFYNAINDADVITYDIGINYFGTYLSDRALEGKAAYVNESGEHFTDLLYKLTPKERQLVEKLRKSIEDALTKADLKMVGEIIDTMLYGVCAYIYYTDLCIDKIYKINPDVELVVVGLYNPKRSIKLNVGSAKIDVSKIADLAMEALNVYSTSLNKHAKQYKYADMVKNPAKSFGDEVYGDKENLDLDIKCNLGVAGYELVKNKDLTIDNYSLYKNQVPSIKTIAAAYNAVSPTDNQKEIVAFTDNFIDICSDAFHTENVPVDKFVSGFMGAKIDKAMLERVFARTATVDDKILLICTVGYADAARGFAGHPSPDGQMQKFKNMKAAYDSNLSAKQTIRNKYVPKSIQVVSSIIKKQAEITKKAAVTIASFTKKTLESVFKISELITLMNR